MIHFDNRYREEIEALREFSNKHSQSLVADLKEERDRFSRLQSESRTAKDDLERRHKSQILEKEEESAKLAGAIEEKYLLEMNRQSEGYEQKLRESEKKTAEDNVWRVTRHSIFFFGVGIV